MLLVDKAVYSKSTQLFGDLNQAIARTNEFIETCKRSKGFATDPRIKDAEKLIEAMDKFSGDIDDLVESYFRAGSY